MDYNIHWSDMNVPVSKESFDILRLSNREPPSVMLEAGEKWYVLKKKKRPNPIHPIYPRLRDFINKHNDVGNSKNIIMVTVDELVVLSSNNYGEILILERMVSTNVYEIIGVIAASYYDFGIKDECPMPTSYISHLCVHRDQREKGIAMKLISLLMTSGYPREIRNGYYICSTPHHHCGTWLQSWYRPLKLDRSVTDGFGVPGYHDGLQDRDKTRFRLKYKTKSPAGWNTKIATLDDSIDLTSYFNLSYKKYITDEITIDYDLLSVRALIEKYDVHIVHYENSIASVVVMHTFDIKLSCTGRISKIVQIILYIESNPKVGVVQNSINVIADYYSKMKGKSAPVTMYGYYVGEISEDTLGQFAHLKTESKTWLEFYNSDILVTPERVHLPIC